MNSDSTAVPTAPQPSRRALLGLIVAGGVAASGLAELAPAQAAPLPAAPVLPAVSPALAKGLNLKSSKYWHLARRVSAAPTAALAKEIKKLGYNKWIDRQLKWKKIKDTTADKLIKKYLSYATMTGPEVYKASKKQAWKAGKALSVSRTIRQVFTKRPLYESMVDTMGDHLYVSADGKASEYVAWFDWAVLRKYALGKYSDLLYAAVRHPALLLYLDNHVNSYDSPNENLGRELLELYTLGVGNYTEADVRNSALILTGHSFDWKTRKYRYNASQHYVGRVKVRGFTHANATREGGPEVLKAYLRYLARNRATAENIARRLAVRYVSDTPSAALIKRLADVYQAEGTSLAAVMRTLLRSSEFAASVGAKWKRPQESIATMLKLRKPSTIKPSTTQAKNVWGITGTVQWLLYLENHQPRMWSAVDGYPDQATDWCSTQSMLAHWYTANAKVNWGDDKEWPSKSWAKALGVKKGQPIAEVASSITLKLTGYTWPAKHLAQVTARLKGTGKGSTLTADQLKYNLGRTLHFIFASPYFKLR
ncbi:MAG: DUF1800 domain-containing protein [Propionicimonas sp.]